MLWTFLHISCHTHVKFSLCLPRFTVHNAGLQLFCILKMFLCLLLLLLLFCFFCFLRQGFFVWPWLSWNSLCRPSWPQIQENQIWSGIEGVGHLCPLDLFLFLCVCVFVFGGVYMYLCILVLQRPLRVVGSDGCKLPDVDAGNQTLSPLREQQVFLASASSLHPRFSS